MKSVRHTLLLAAWLAAAACGDDDPLVREIPIPDDPEASATSPAAQAGPATSTAVEPQLRVPLRPVGDSDVGGEVLLEEQGLATAVQATFGGVPEGELLYAHVHQGPCAAAVESRAEFGDLGAMRAGPGGTISFVIERTLQELLDGGYSIGLHRAADTPDLACADVAPAR